MIQLPDDTADSWLSVLKPYQRSTIDEFLKDGNEEDAINKWLNSAGASDTSKFGGSQTSNANKGEFSKQFWLEFRKLICGSENYENEIKGFNSLVEENKAKIVGFLSTVLAGIFGVSAIFLAPIIVLAIISITKVGVNAWCNM